MYKRPTSTPWVWGKVRSCKTICPSVYKVSTESHGGIMVHADAASDLLSTDAINCGFINCNSFYCFEEDCQASVVIRELLDKNLWKIPSYYADDKDKYNEIIDNSLIRWNSEYWEARGNVLPMEALIKRLYERLNQNFHDYCDSVVKANEPSSSQKINLDVQEVSAVNNAFSYLTKEHVFDLSQVNIFCFFKILCR